MCPTVMAIASFAIGAASSVMGYVGQKQAVDSQEEQYRRNAENAKMATSIKEQQINRRILQEGEAAAQKKFETNLDAKRAIATATTAAGEGGVSGLSVSHVLGSIYAQSGRFNASVDRNLDINRSYFRGEKEAAHTQGQAQINSVALPEKPSFLPALIGVFGSGVDAYGRYKQATA